MTGAAGSGIMEGRNPLHLPMNMHNEFLQDLIDVTMNLPEAQRIEAMEECIASALNHMDRVTILKVCNELDLALVDGREHESMMNLIEGHLALRNIEQQPVPVSSPERDFLWN
jgi:site-specific recombinase XerC